MHLAVAIGALIFSCSALAFAVWSSRKTAQLHEQTMRNYETAAANYAKATTNYAQAAANWDHAAELNRRAAADWAVVRQARGRKVLGALADQLAPEDSPEA